MKYFTHKYNNTFFDFFIFGDRLFTNLFRLCDKISLNHGSPLINYAFYTDIQTYIERLSRIKAPTAQSFYLVAQYQIDCISDLINVINDKWEENKKEFPDERNRFITDVPLKQFLPLIASHSLNKYLVDCFYILNNEEINCGLIFNPLLSMEQVITLIKQNQDLGRYLIQDTSYKLTPELLQFLVSLDCSDGRKNSECGFIHDILSSRNNLNEQDIVTILPILNSHSINKIVLYQPLPQYINESLSFVHRNFDFFHFLTYKYQEQSIVLARIKHLSEW